MKLACVNIGPFHCCILLHHVPMSLFVPPSVDGYLGCFQFASIMNKATMNFIVPISENICTHFGWLKLFLSNYLM